jgi:glucans biosynthesis protein
MLYRRGRQGLVLPAALVIACLPFSQPLLAEPEFESDPSPFSQRWLQTHARELSARDYSPDTMTGDNPLHSLSYDDYRRIVFEPEAAIWSGNAFPFQLHTSARN